MAAPQQAMPDAPPQQLERQVDLEFPTVKSCATETATTMALDPRSLAEAVDAIDFDATRA
jgi:hypothetical protein